MSRQSFRFAVGTNENRRSQSYTISARPNKGDIYIIGRELNGNYKFTSHRGGHCHLKRAHLKKQEWTARSTPFMRIDENVAEFDILNMIPICEIAIPHGSLSKLPPLTDNVAKTICWIAPVQKNSTVIGVFRARLEKSKNLKSIFESMQFTQFLWYQDIGEGESCIISARKFNATIPKSRIIVNEGAVEYYISNENHDDHDLPFRIPVMQHRATFPKNPSSELDAPLQPIPYLDIWEFGARIFDPTDESQYPERVVCATSQPFRLARGWRASET